MTFWPLLWPTICEQTGLLLTLLYSHSGDFVQDLFLSGFAPNFLGICAPLMTPSSLLSGQMLMPVTDRRGRQVACVYQAFPLRQVVWACGGDRHTRAPHPKHADDVCVYRAASDKIAPGAIPATWRLLTAWKSPQCVQVYKDVLEFGYRLALGACRPLATRVCL